MAKKHQKSPLVTSIGTTLKKSISETQAVTPEEIKRNKREMLDITTTALEVFKKNLNDGLVSINSTMDLERIVKLNLLLSGEADNITGKPVNEVEETTTNEAIVSMSKVEEILTLDDPEVQAMYDRLFMGYNKSNDEKQ